MPRLTDLTRVRALLDLDPAWSAYAIGDLSPEFAVHCTWHAPAGDAPAIVLLYRGFEPAIVFASGTPGDLAPLFHELDAREVSLHVRPDAIEPLSTAYRITQTRPFWRMITDRESFRGESTEAVIPLGERDIPAVEALYDDGRRHEEGPTFFQPSMLRQGSFRGIVEGEALIAIAGTHLFSPELGVCTIGNVYTRRDRRRRGLGASVTSAVVQHALTHDIATIVLNVGQDNDSARRVYERLGFGCHCEFLEGAAVRHSTD